MIPVDEWDRLNEEAYRLCHEQKSAAPLQPLDELTGIEWCEAAVPGKLPPTPGVRNVKAATSRLPRRLRRHASRMLTCEDQCGAAEVLGVLHDADLEVRLVGVDRRLDYLTYLAEVPYDVPILRFIHAVYHWLTGESERQAALVVYLWSLGLMADRAENAEHRIVRSLALQRPPPLEARPAITPTGPPAHLGGDKAAHRLVAA